jgi:hypothetical protein
MIRLKICKTGKSYSPKEKRYTMYDTQYEHFKDKDEALEWLKAMYGKCKRVKMYVDTKDGAIHIGYVYHFRGDDGQTKYLGQDWVEFQEIKPVVLS